MTAPKATSRPLALVTGGMHRIGAVIAGRLADAGYDLALHCRTDNQPETPLAKVITRNGTSSHSFCADLSTAGSADGLFDAVIARFGRAPTLLINNASQFVTSSAAVPDAPRLVDAMMVNMIAPIQLAKRLAAQGNAGCIINILDQRIRNPVPDQFDYTLTKQALWQATRTMAFALAPNIRVNAVAPGLTLPTADYAQGQMARVAAMMPLARLATPSDIADAVLYLVGAAAVSGQTIFVDGGANLRSFDRDFAYL
ncbi:MAG: SDR family oxidoreductase [Pseudomonadota bacterium]